MLLRLCQLMFTTSDDNKMKMAECGGIDVLFNALKTHISNADVCEQGCGALCSITFNYSSSQ